MTRALDTSQTPEQKQFDVQVEREQSRTLGAQSIRRIAVFIAHGMGQQIPFQTLAQVATGIRKVDLARSGDDVGGGGSAVGRSLKSATEQRLERLELELHPGAETVHAHVYEAYWAPLTEGKVTLRDVIRFLSGAGWNGVKNARGGTFVRYLFGQFKHYPIPTRTIVHLLVALASIASLVVMNSTIVTVAAGRALLAQRPEWLTDGLLADLTTVFNVVITVMAVFGLSLLVAVLLRVAGARHREATDATGIPRDRAVRTAWTWLTVVLFAGTLTVVILAGAAIPTLFLEHVRGGVGADLQLWRTLFSPSAVDAFNRTFDRWAWFVALWGAAAFIGWWTINIIRGAVSDLSTSRERLHTLLNVTALVGVAAAAIWLVLELQGATDGIRPSMRTGLAWVLLIGASAFIRKLLVQYLGDVAAYVMPYRLDSFAAVRTEIKARVYGAIRAIYAMQRVDGRGPEYDQVIVVAHSLGSVIAYDALNQLALEEEGAAQKLDIAGRTALFLTFGSPLDKTAFIFALQGGEASAARETVAASVQPLIRSYDYRPRRWVNIYSPWDIISGHLDLYDLPDSDDPRCVENCPDPDAATLLIAHTEYWTTELVFKEIYDAIAAVAAGPRSGTLPTARGGGTAVSAKM